jgi:hypothetical protein
LAAVAVAEVKMTVVVVVPVVPSLSIPWQFLAHYRWSLAKEEMADSMSIRSKTMQPQVKTPTWVRFERLVAVVVVDMVILLRSPKLRVTPVDPVVVTLSMAQP